MCVVVTSARSDTKDRRNDALNESNNDFNLIQRPLAILQTGHVCASLADEISFCAKDKSVDVLSTKPSYGYSRSVQSGGLRHSTFRRNNG